MDKPIDKQLFIGISEDLLMFLMSHGWELVDVGYDGSTMPHTPRYTMVDTSVRGGWVPDDPSKRFATGKEWSNFCNRPADELEEAKLSPSDVREICNDLVRSVSEHGFCGSPEEA